MRFLLACSPIPGHLHPNLALARTLVSRGHQVALYCGSNTRRTIEGEGFRYYPFGPSMDERLLPLFFPPEGHSAASRLATDRQNVFHLRRLNSTLKELFLETIPEQVQDLENASADFRPDLLVTDQMLFGPILILKETSPTPVAIFSVLAGCSIPGPQAPLWGPGLPPPAGRLSRVRIALHKRLAELFTGDFVARANRLRAGYGLPPLAGRVADEYGKVPLFLVSSTPSFDYFRTDLPPCVAYIGACVWDGGRTEPAPAWLEALPSSPPVVHVTEGTLHTSQPILLRAAAQGLSGRPVQVIMTTGRHRRPEELDLGTPGANIRIEQFVPHSPLFAKTDVVITTGGAGTVCTSLIAGVPLVVVPTSWELPENAQRVVQAGAGLRLDPARCTPDRLWRAVQTVLQDTRYRDNARTIGQALVREGGAPRAAGLLEKLAASQNIPTLEPSL